MKFRDRLALFGASVAALTTAFATPTFAQAPSEPAASSADEEIVVTGSRIRRADLTSAAPIQVITSETIDRSGATNLADVLNAVPGNGIPVNPIGDQASFATGRNFVNIFNLGSQRTLTLVNGRRFVTSNAAQIVGGLAQQGTQVDLNSVPTALIDRIETIQAGGAAVYGSDAVAGVINIIMKDDYEGFEIDAQYGVSERDDYENERLRATYGVNFLDGRGNIAFAAEYNTTGELTSASRERLARQLVFATNPANTSATDGIPGSILIENRRIPELTEGGLPFRSNSISLAQLITMPDPNNPGQRVAAQFDTNGNLVPYRTGQFFQASIASGGDGFNLAGVSALSSPVERVLLTSIGHVDLTPNIRLSGEALWNRVESTETANQPVYQSGLFGGTSGNLAISVNNPFLTDQARGILTSQPTGALTQFFLARASTDLVGGSNQIVSEADTYRALLALDGDFQLANRDYFWNIAGSVGRSTGYFSQPSIVQSRFANAVNAVRNTSNQIVCAINADAITTNDDPNCAPLNLFGRGAPSAAALNYITTNFQSDYNNEQKVYEASFGGSPFSLPAGDFSFAVGYEQREENANFKPNEAFRLGIGRSVAIAPIRGGYETEEFYGEFLLPIFGEDFTFPLMHRFEVEAAWRDVDNTQAGKSNAHTYGVRYYPIEDLMLRGTISQTFRAPAIAELFLPQVTAFSTATDPCDARNINGGPSPANRRANCAAAFQALGLPANFQLTSNVQSFTIQIITGGNPTLKNEEAESWSTGFVYQPSWLDGFTISGDWVNIDLTNSIENFTLTAILQTCYDSPGYPVGPCGNFTRDSAGQVVAATTGRVNAGYRYFQGATLSVNYETDLSDWFAFRNVGDAGSVAFDLDVFHVNRLETSVNGTGTDLNDDKDEIGVSDLEWNLRTTYTRGPFEASLFTRYIGDAVFDTSFTTESRNILDLDPYFLNDISFNYDFTDNITGRFVVQNMFDVEPPYPTASANVYDLIGRYFFVGVNAKF
ncbi:MAG: TonB-dependent receptor [Hyphomonadaceae bacterium]|nr:TonB-dependent receptor [Hyphomonadaceae bacterium]